jgi:PAS domain S-box-containing protein
MHMSNIESMRTQPKSEGDDVQRLQSCINDLISVQAFAAVWRGQKPARIVRTLLEMLVRMLRLDFAYAKICASDGGAPMEIVRPTLVRSDAKALEMGHALEAWLSCDGPNPFVMPNPVGDGEISVALFRFGLQDEMGTVAAGSQRSDFPTPIDMLLLRVAGNQAAIALQEARRLNEQKRAAQELERRVEERTRQLTAVNLELRKEIVERQHAEAEQSKFASLVANSTDFIGIASLEGHALFVNRAGREMVGLGDEHWPRSIVEYVMEDEREKLKTEIWRILQRNGNWAGELRFNHFKTGAPIPMLSQIFFIKEPASDRRLALATISRDITERKHAEAVLRESEERFRLMVEGVKDYAIFLLDKEGRVTSWNAGAERLKGYREEEILREHFSRFYPAHEIAKGKPQEQLKLATANGRAEDEGWRVRKDGSRFWAGTLITALHNEEGKLVGFSKLIRDISERKRADEALERSREVVQRQFAELRAIYETAPVGLCFVSPRWLIFSINAQLAEMAGMHVGDHIGRSLREVMPVFAQKIEPIFERVINERNPALDMEIDGLATGHLGERVWQINLYPVRRRNLTIVGVNVVVQDITERKRAEQELRRSEAHLAEGQRLSKMGSWTWNISTGELFWSAEQFRIFNLDPEKGAPPLAAALQLVHGEDRSFVQQALETAVREENDFEWDCRIVASDGTVKTVHTTAHPVFESGQLAEYIGTTVDITERKQAEEALHEAREELTRVSRVVTIGELAASIAHEVNQPLAAVVTNANAGLRWLASANANLDEAREALSRIVRDGNRASSVIAKIRTLIRKTGTEKELLDVKDTLDETIAIAQGEIRRRDVALRTELADDLPVVLADRVQLQQVLLNLIMNGIEAMSAISDRPREMIIAVAEDLASKVRVAVRDSGVGIEPRSVDKIFEAFYTTKPQGLGIGLSISRSIIEAHGGRLWAAQNDGAGATFQFTLPVYRADVV